MAATSSTSSGTSTSTSTSTSTNTSTTTSTSNSTSASTSNAKDSSSVGCQTEPNLIDKLIDCHVRKRLDDVDLYQEYVRSVQCAQFWPLDKNPIRSLVPAMLQVELPEQHLKNESLMFDLVQAITNNSKLVDLLAKYIHHIVPNVIISKRVDLIPLITCTIRVCREPAEQERLLGLLFNLIKRPNEEQRRMILSGIIVVLQVSPQQSSSLLLPNLWDHVNDKFPERRVLLAESCATLAHYVRPAMRSKLILAILIQLLRDKSPIVRSAAFKSFACLMTLIMDRNDEVFDACQSATEDMIQDVVQASPVTFCEHRYELEQMRLCALDTVYPLLCMWAVKLNRFKLEIAEFYLLKAETGLARLVGLTAAAAAAASSAAGSAVDPNGQDQLGSIHGKATDLGGITSRAAALAAAAVARRRSVFLEARNSDRPRRLSALTSAPNNSGSSAEGAENGASSKGLGGQRLAGAYLRLLCHMVPFVFSDAVHSCAWLSKSNISSRLANQPRDSNNNNTTTTCNTTNPDDGWQQPQRIPNLADNHQQQQKKNHQHNHSQNQQHELLAEGELLDERNSVHAVQNCSSTAHEQERDIVKQDQRQDQGQEQQNMKQEPSQQLFNRPLNLKNRLTEPTLIIDEAAIVAFHDQLAREHMLYSLDWLIKTFLPKYLNLMGQLTSSRLLQAIGATTGDQMQEFLLAAVGSMRHLCLLFGKYFTKTTIRPLVRHLLLGQRLHVLVPIYIASLTSFEPIEQAEFEEVVLIVRLVLGSNRPGQQHQAQLQQQQDELDLAAATATPRPDDTGTTTQKASPLAANEKRNQKQAKSVAPQSWRLTRDDVEVLAVAFKMFATRDEHINSPSTRQRFLSYLLDALMAIKKESIMIMFRYLLSCLIEPSLRPPDWTHLLVAKFLPLLMSLANDSSDVHVCTYARLMCAQLVETFHSHLEAPEVSSSEARSMLPALTSLRTLTEQIKASNLRRQIECLIQNCNERSF